MSLSDVFSDPEVTPTPAVNKTVVTPPPVGNEKLCDVFCLIFLIVPVTALLPLITTLY